MSDPADNSAVFEITSKIMISVVIVFFVVIVLVFLLHLYARCLWSASPEDPEIVSWRRQLATQNRQSEAARRRQKGLKSSTLKSLPIAVYNPKEFKDGLECPICLSELQEGEHARILPNCNHGFHLDCIDKWFHSHSNCPICRTSVEAVSDSDLNSNSSPVESQQAAELPVFPTNVLFWGDEVQVRTSEESVSSSDSLAIDIPMEGESCSVPDNSSSTANADDEAKSPVETRLKSLKRLLSRGKRVNPFPSSSSSSGSADVEQV